jgi:uncharacterized protein (TIGR02996 family)
LSDDDDLLAQIRAAPNSNAPRLVYADRLLERGDPRGELITLECTHSKDLRRMELRKQLETQWLKETGLQVQFERGMVHAIYGKLQQIIAHRRILVTEPVEIVHVDADAEMSELAALAELAYIGKLVLRSRARPLIDRNIAELAGAHFDNLRKLEISGGNLGAAGAAALAAAPWAARLDHLSIRGNPLGESGAAALGSGNLRNLNALDIETCAIGRGAHHLVRQMPGLLSLKLRSNGIDEAAVRELAAVPSRLSNLDLHGNRPGTAMPCWPTLRRLALAGCQLETVANIPLHLTELEVYYNQIVDPRPLAASTTIKLLDLSLNPIDGDAWSVLAAGLPALTSLRVSQRDLVRPFFEGRPAVSVT